jgi:hypothetical protein
MNPELNRITAKEIMAGMTFKQTPVRGDTIMLTGSITFHATVMARQSTFGTDEAVHAREHLAQLIMRRIYDFDRQELYEAIHELKMASPFDYPKMEQAFEKILNAALKQPPQ